MTGIISKPLLFHLVGCLYYLYQWCTVKQISGNEIYLLIKYIKSVLWRVAKHLSYIEDARCLKVNFMLRTLENSLCVTSHIWWSQIRIPFPSLPLASDFCDQLLTCICNAHIFTDITCAAYVFYMSSIRFLSLSILHNKNIAPYSAVLIFVLHISTTQNQFDPNSFNWLKKSVKISKTYWQYGLRRA